MAVVNIQIAENVIIRVFVMNGVIKMGMSIDETIEILHGRDKCMEYVTDNDSEAFEMAISIMRKYQQIEQILDDCDLEAWEVLEKIKEVVADGNDTTNKRRTKSIP